MQTGSDTKNRVFKFKQFEIHHDRCSMKVGTDGVLLGAWVNVDERKRILDIGTGSGVIAVMLAQRQPEAIVDGVEIDAKAYTQASENMKTTPWESRLNAIQMPIQEYAFEHSEAYDLIVSNPPFFSGGVFSQSQDRANVRHTIKLSHGDLLRSARRLLAQNGRFCVILPMIEGLRFQEIASQYHFYCTRRTEVIPVKGKTANRLLLQFEKEEKDIDVNSLTIRNTADEFTKAYKELTSAFYLKF